MPISRFSVNDSDQCIKNHLFNFTNNSTIPTGTNSFIWNFGDNTSSTASAPTKAYDSANNFLVTLIASSNNNCKDTSSKPVVTYAQPVAKFNIKDSLQCFRSHLFAFTNNSSNFDIPSYFWHYGNGDTSNQRNPIYVYDTNGVFKINLTVVTQFGCKDSSIQFVETYPMPLANFTINDTGQCIVNNQFVFTNNSSIAYNKMTYSWDLNDGTKGTLDTIKHTYLNDGKYTIQLVANSEKGCLDTIKKKVAVFPMPVAKFELSDTAMCELGNNFNYKNLSTILYDTLNYKWEFGNGNFSDLKSPNHSYLNEGVYDIRLLVTSEMGCIDSTKSKIEIHPMPIAKFNTNDTDQCLGSNSFSITNESLISKGNLSNNWNLGDGASSNLLNLTHQYKAFGDYLVTLITTSNKNCKDTSYQNIKVYSHPIIKYKLNNKESCLKNNKFILEDITTHTSKTKNWDWIFYKANSGLDLTFNTSNVELQFNKIGKYFYQLILTDSNICSDTINDYLQVLPQSKLDFYSDTVCIGEENTFTSNCSVDSGSITELKWEFGDGTSDINTNTTHKYTSPGNYNVTLTSNNSFNCKDTLTKPNSAQSRDIPTASFTYDKILDSLTYTGYKFQSTSIGLSKLAHFWTFNNNLTSTDVNPYTLFSDSGLKWIELEVEDQFGCKNQTGKWIKASPEMLVYIPNSFSPNEDGINDSFKPYGVVYPKEYEWIVLDRWGGVIYKSNNYLEGWNGKIKDKLVPDGVYAYVLKVTTAQNKKLRFGGTFHIIY
jgi:gliding motility-associated-like protein